MFRKKDRYAPYTEKKKGREKFLFLAALFAFLCVLSWLVQHFLIGTFEARSDAMFPVLSPGERFIASPLYFLSETEANEAARGDIVLVQAATGEKLAFPLSLVRAVVSFVTFHRVRLFASRDTWGELPVARRLLGLPGDTIYMENFVLYIRPAASEHFLTEFELLPQGREYSIITSPFPENWASSLPFSGSFDPVELKEGEYFVVCDNRIAANDSRAWGAVGAKSIKGKALFRYWPLSKMERLD